MVKKIMLFLVNDNFIKFSIVEIMLVIIVYVLLNLGCMEKLNFIMYEVFIFYLFFLFSVFLYMINLLKIIRKILKM